MYRSCLRNLGWLFLLGPLGCVPKPQQPLPVPVVQDPQAAASEKKDETSQDAPEKFLVVADAKVEVEKALGLSAAGFIPGLQVPAITFSKLAGATHVEVLRCPQSYVLRGSTGETLEEMRQGPQPGDHMKWAYIKALDDNRQCKIVGTNIRAKVFYDLPAPSGSYYYVVNPCVSSEKSLTFKAGCSFDLKVTGALTYEAKAKKEMLDKLAKVSQAEGKLRGLLIEGASLADKIAAHLEACEERFAADQQMLRFQRGVTRFALLAGGALLFSPLGPNPSIMAAQMASTMVYQWMSSGMLGGDGFQWAQAESVAYMPECINPEALPLPPEERKKAKEGVDKNGKYNGQYKGKYEEEYGVQVLTKRLATMSAEADPKTGFAGGAIAQAANELKAAMEEAKGIDTRVVLIDEAYAKAANQGLIDAEGLFDFSKLAAPERAGGASGLGF